MASSNGQNYKIRNIVLSVLAGIVCAIGGAFISFWLIVFSTGSALIEGGAVFILSLTIVIGVITGTVGGRKTYKWLSKNTEF